MEGETRVGGTSYGAIVATLEKLTEAIDLLNRVDDQRAEQIASLEVAQAGLRSDVLTLAKQFRALQDTEAEVVSVADVETPSRRRTPE